MLALRKQGKGNVHFRFVIECNVYIYIYSLPM